MKLKPELIKSLDGVLQEEYYVYYPARYHKVALAGDSGILGLFIVVNSKSEYVLINMPMLLRVTIDAVADVVIDTVPYKKITILAGHKLFEHQNTIPSLDEPFIAFDEFCVRNGNIPFYVGYTDLLNFFLKASDLVSFPISRDIVAMSMIISIIARDSSNKFYKETYAGDVKWIGMNDKNLGNKNLMSAISAGTYLDKGVNASLLMTEYDDSNIVDVFDS